jgi:hypothetical protein
MVRSLLAATALERRGPPRHWSAGALPGIGAPGPSSALERRGPPRLFILALELSAHAELKELLDNFKLVPACCERLNVSVPKNLLPPFAKLVPMRGFQVSLTGEINPGFIPSITN